MNELLFELISVDEISKLIDTVKSYNTKTFLKDIPEGALKELQDFFFEKGFSYSQAQIACLMACENMKFK